MIYLDQAATTKMSAAALTAYQTVAQSFYANSDSLHQPGTAAGSLIAQTQNDIGTQLGVAADSLIFTSGGTQSNQLGIAALAQGGVAKTVLVSPLEHSSVYQVLDNLVANNGIQVETLPVDASGLITPEALKAALTPQVGLVIVQAVNPITGIIQDIAALNRIALTHRTPLFVDAVQALTKIPCAFLSGVAGFSASAHKFNGPKGCGLLYLNPNQLVHPLFKHVFQQQGFLPGTLDTPAIVSMGAAFNDNWPRQAENLEHLGQLKRTLLQQLHPTIVPVCPNSGYAGICGLILPHTQGQAAATTLGQQGICFSTVSACSIKDPRPDRTLSALGLSTDQMSRFIRLSFGAENTVAELNVVANKFNELYS